MGRYEEFGEAVLAQPVAPVPPAYQAQNVVRLKQKVIVKKYLINGGLDMKFEHEEFPAGLAGIVPHREFKELIEALNDALSRHRSKKVDQALLVASMALLPMIPFVMRRKKRSKARKAAMKPIIEAFNNNHVNVMVRIDRNSGFLIFEGNPDLL
eukprot:m.332183 g.332183  ORF g.332183 m.332183 type:complete len:154 (+) comp16894_c0_seq1:89-550(+)